MSSGGTLISLSGSSDGGCVRFPHAHTTLTHPHTHLHPHTCTTHHTHAPHTHTHTDTDTQSDTTVGVFFQGFWGIAQINAWYIYSYTTGDKETTFNDFNKMLVEQMLVLCGKKIQF